MSEEDPTLLERSLLSSDLPSRCQARLYCPRSPVMGSRCVLHHTRRMAVRRGLYPRKWYKKIEPVFTGGLVVRFQMLLDGESVLPAEEFVSTVVPKPYLRHTTKLVEIVRAIDRKANESHGSDQEERRPV